MTDSSARSGASGPTIYLTNTLTGKKEEFTPQQPGKVTFYSCGPTVYDFIHIGNLRGALVADLFYRYFKERGFEVNHVRNYTDVDDKIIKKGQQEGISAEAVAKKYTLEVEKDFALAGMLEPTHKTRATEHIPEMIAMIQAMVARGKAYVADDGEVLCSISSFHDYGKLSHKKIDDLQAGIRVEVSQKKKNPLDFTLWKPAKPGEPAWESPWGKGRPGWHIECSAMAVKWLGNSIDLHHGGEDLVFPHHENEIVQAEGATGVVPFVHYWVHHAFLIFSKEKMSKSLGNVLTARQFLSQYSGELARYIFLSVHYRSQIEFGAETVENGLTGLQRIYEAKAKASELAAARRLVADRRAESAWGNFLAHCEKARDEIAVHYANDLNTAGALASLFSLIREFNRVLAEPFSSATPAGVLGAQHLIELLEQEIGSVIGIGRLNPENALKDLNRMRASLSSAGGQPARPSETEILALIQARNDARKAKDFTKADDIRKELDQRGVQIKDSAGGTTWEYK